MEMRSFKKKNVSLVGDEFATILRFLGRQRTMEQRFVGGQRGIPDGTCFQRAAVSDFDCDA